MPSGNHMPGVWTLRVTDVQFQSVSLGKIHYSRREIEKTQLRNEKTVKWARKAQEGAKCYSVDLRSLIG